jgi:fused signal recognition particle receptor
MFEALKKKLSSWLGKPEKTAKKKKDKSAKKKSKKEKKQKKEQEAEIPSDEQLKELSKKIEQTAPVKIDSTGMQSVVDTEAIEKEIEVKEEPKQGFFGRLFSKFKAGITSTKITKEDFNEIFSELEMILLENNVALSVVDKIKSSLEKSLVNTEVKKAEIESKITSALKESITSVLQEPQSFLEKIKTKKPFIILFFGINGTGKTTSIAKIAHLLKKNNISSVMAAADTFRAASIEQLKTHGERLNIQVISQQYNSDPAAVAFDAIQYAKKHAIDVVLIDTAGRMHTKENLIKEMEKIVRVSKPDLKLFVGEAITGNDAVEQARTFNEAVGIDGIILSKADVDEKAGAILSVSHVTGKPIYFLGIGQGYDDLAPFTKNSVLKNLGLD